MNKYSLSLFAFAFLANGVFAQSAGTIFSPWLIALFLAIVLIMFAIFWLMKMQSPQLPLPPLLPNSGARSAHGSDHSYGVPTSPKPQHGFYELSSENKPIPDDKILLAGLKSKIHEVKQHGIPKREEADPKIVQAVDEILEEEFKRRSPEFRGEKKEISILPSPPQIQTGSISIRSISKKAPKTRPFTNLPLPQRKKREIPASKKTIKKSKSKLARAKSKPKQKPKSKIQKSGARKKSRTNQKLLQSKKQVRKTTKNTNRKKHSGSLRK